MAQVNRLGQVTKVYDLGNYKLHHDYVFDENGNMVPDADNLEKFAVSGKASIVGVDNGKQESAELYKYDYVDKSSYSERMAYNGKVLVILKSEKEAGDALLTISSDNLKPVQVALKVT